MSFFLRLTMGISLLLLAACGGKASKKHSSAGGGSISSKADDRGTMRAAVSARTGGELDLSKSSNKSLRNTKVVIPPGALSVDTEIQVKEVTPVVNTATSEALELSTAAPAGPSVAIEASDMNALTGSLAIGLPYTDTASLTETSSYIVIGVYSSGTNSVVETFVGSELTIKPDVIEVKISKFGAYQVARVQEEVTKKKETTEATYVDKYVADATGASINAAFMITNEAELPDCDETRMSHLYFVSSSQTFYNCNGTKWAAVNVSGAKGDKGDKGDTGDSAALGPVLLAGDGSEFGFFKGFGNNIWVEFVEGFYSLLDTVSTDVFKVRREPMYYTQRDCGGDPHLENPGVFDRERATYTNVSQYPFVAKTGEALSFAPKSIRRIDEPCHNLLALDKLDTVRQGDGSSTKHIYGPGSWGVFSAYDNASGEEIYVTDGTESGTFLLKDINPGSSSSWPAYFVAAGSVVYFRANDGTNGEELWKTDGTVGGTVLVKDIRTGSSGSSPQHIVPFGSGILFSADDGVSGRELWSSDGTAGNTVLEDDIKAGASGSSPSHMTVLAGNVYFAADSGNGTELHKYNGTTVTELADIRSGVSGSYPGNLTVLGSDLLFSADDGSGGNELYIYSGSVSLVKDIRSGSSSSYPTNFLALGSVVYFRADDGSNGYELWKSDGTTGGTVLVKDIHTSSGSYPSQLTDIGNGKFVFKGTNSSGNNRAFVSDGTAANTVELGSMNPGYDAFFGLSGGKVYFPADDGSNGEEIWVSDGTPGGTSLLLDARDGPSGSDVQNLVAFDGNIYMSMDIGDGAGYSFFTLSRGTNQTTDEDLSLIPNNLLEAEELTGFKPVTSSDVFTKQN